MNQKSNRKKEKKCNKRKRIAVIKIKSVNPVKFKIMKLQSNYLLDTLTIDELTTLTTEVKETLMPVCKKENKAKLTVADLWNIHRQKKNISSRRSF